MIPAGACRAHYDGHIGSGEDGGVLEGAQAYIASNEEKERPSLTRRNRVIIGLLKL